MKYNLYAIYDAAAEIYSQPQVYVTDNVAMRAFTQAANDPESSISIASSDYTLFRIAAYDDTSGEIKPEVTPVNLGLALNFKKEK